MEAARTADGGLSIYGHVHRITRSGERVARWLATDGDVLCALTAKRTKSVNRLTLRHAELIAAVGPDNPSNDAGLASTRWTIQLQGRALLFEALSERDAARWVATLSRIRERALVAPAELPVDAERRCVPLAPSRGAADGGATAPAAAAGAGKPQPTRAPPVAPEPPAYSILKFFCACDLAPLTKARRSRALLSACVVAMLCRRL